MSQATLEAAPQGEAAVILYLGRDIDPAVNARVRTLARRLAQDPPAGVREVMGAYACLQVQFDPALTDHDQVTDQARRALDGLSGRPPEPGRVVEVPVVYGGEHGPDLAYVAEHAGLTPREVIARHGGRDHLCHLVGFTPGFPFLGGLDPVLACPRLDSPRSELPPGAVGIGGAQTGLYPLGGPGGWRIMGRTPLLAWDPFRRPAALFQAGDLVRFMAVDGAEFPEPPRGRLEWESDGIPALEVLAPGGLTTIQDAGRWGRQSAGVPLSGALDRLALAAANALTGNEAGAAALELTLLGPRLRALAPTVIAVTGADLGPRVDGLPAPMWRAVPLAAGQVLDFSGPRSGARAILAVAGGLASRPLLGSRSTYLLGRLGAPPAAGETLAVRPGPLPPAEAALPAELHPGGGREVVLRAVPGPNQDHFTAAGRRTFFGGEYRLSPHADRRGARLIGPAVERDPARPESILSEPNAPGVVQVPPGGQPIVLLNEQTTGGYAKIATVVGPDLDLLARALPGDRLRFQAVSAAEAVAIARRRARLVADLPRLVRP